MTKIISVKLLLGKEILKQKNESFLGFDVSVVRNNSRLSCHVREMHFPFSL